MTKPKTMKKTKTNTKTKTKTIIKTNTKTLLDKENQLKGFKFWLRCGFYLYALSLLGGVIYKSQLLETSPWPMMSLYILPLLVANYCFIVFKPALLHLGLVIILFHLCLTAPSLFVANEMFYFGLVQLLLNLFISFGLMLYMLKSSQLFRLQRQAS